MPRKAATSDAKTTSPSVSVGDVVWASHPALWEAKEPALVLKIGCDYEDDEGIDRTDGILVKFQVNNTRRVIPPSAVGALEEAGTEEDSGTRRSTRVSRSQAQQSPTDRVTPGETSKTGTGGNSRRAMVTPSPTTVLNGSGSEGNEDGDGLFANMKEKKGGLPSKRGRSAEAKNGPRKRQAVATASKEKSNGQGGMEISEDEEEKKEVESPYFGKAKKAPTSKAKKVAAKKKASASAADNSVPDETAEDEDEESSEDEPLSALVTSKKATPKKKTAVTKITATKKAAAKKTVTKKAGAKKNAGKGGRSSQPEDKLIVIADDDRDEEDAEDAASGDDEQDDDKPFQVEYATSGRATCRRCDETIAKGTLRVSHVPLFRGKPGFRVYRHLECSVFDENIVSVEQIGGWRGIKRQSLEDYERLVMRVEESKLEIEQENEELQPDELVQVNFEGEMRSAPKELTANLLPFQVEGHSWMYHQERNVPEIRGGILADEMGMGKTLQTIATILDNRPMLQHSRPGAKHPPSAQGAELENRKLEENLWDNAVGDWRHELKMNNVPEKLAPKKPHRAGTLVVCPVIALTQWKTEIEKFTTENATSIAIYHGPDRAKNFPIQKLCKYDIILTTYQVLEQDFRKMVSPNKVTCPNCNAKFKIDKLRIHLKYFCGEGAQKTEAQARQERTRDVRNGRGNNGNSSNSGGKGSGMGKLSKKKTFPEMTETQKANNGIKSKGKASKPPIKPSKKGKKTSVRKGASKASKQSDSEDTADAIVPITPRAGSRPSRSAALAAGKRVSSSVKEWSATKESSFSKDDDESFGAKSSAEEDDDDESVMTYDDEDSQGEAILSKPKAKTTTKRTAVSESFDDTDDSDDSEDDAALARARKKQANALKQANKGKSGGKKSSPSIRKGKFNPSKGTKKKFVDESSSNEDSDDEIGRGDPLEGIDLDELMQEAMEGSRMSVLHSMCWWRVVLDEAHMIKSRSSQTAAAAFALIGINRWALSGTPLQNRVGELYSLIRFLRIEPMAFYFCRQKGCGCKSIHYRIKNGKCQDCDHRAFSHYAHFNRHVLNPIQRDGYSGDGRKAMFTLKSEVLDKSLLRRTKETRAEDLQLAPRIVSIRTIKLHPIELDFYNALYTQTKSSFADYVAQGTLLNNYAHIFDLLTRMRQAVDHPYLIVYSKRNCEHAASAVGQPRVANGSVDCSLCQELPTERVVSSCCGAAYCKSCVMEYMAAALDDDENSSTPCPSCGSPFSIDLNQAASDVVDDSTLAVPMNEATPKNSGPTDCLGPSLKELPHVNSGSILRRINLAEFATSTKIEALVQELIEMRKARPGSKALVFSQFVNMLDLIRWRLHSDPCLGDMGLGARILHGSMDVKARDQCLKDFREDNSVRVLLMSLKAGGVALNLTVASEVFLVDNWWNPAAEMQAIDRTHRLGQHRCIRAVRFIAEGTVEERVLQLQEKKRLVFDGTVGRDAGSLKMLSADDMASLFA